ncbi:MAG: hypothetical protein SVU32_04205, partial [Candidatus Nanohaloarchaea archaeon]|nr:hypothetical protein [Candidatus Nanohaloarchaea archaeon]
MNADDSIDVSLTDNSDNEDNFRVQISRDGGSYTSPSGGPTTFSTSSQSSTGTTYTKNYNPNSDNAYASQVGIDSSFTFR